MRPLARRLSFITVILLVWLASAAAENGAALFEKSCASCHGMDGAGKTNARKKMSIPNLLDKQFVEMTDKQLFETIGRGKDHKEYPHTYLYTGMNEQQVTSLVSHIRTLQKK